MPTRPQLAPETQSTPAPGYCSEPARTPTTPRVYLWASGAGRGSRSRTSCSCSAVTAGAGRSSPMSTRCTTPQAIAAGSTRWATLWVPKVTVTAATTCGPSTWPVSTSTPDGASTATTGTPSTADTAAAASSRSPPPTADADDPVHHDVGRRGLGDGRRPPGRPPTGARRDPAAWAFAGASSSASTATPRRASSAPAYNASPPLSPDPTSSSTRAPYARPRRSSTA